MLLLGMQRDWYTMKMAESRPEAAELDLSGEERSLLTAI